MLNHLLKILRESIKAVPAMRYALAVAGLLAVVAMVGAFKLSPQMAVLGTVVTLVLMVAMVVFARLTTTAPRHFLLPVKFMLWSFLVVTVATAFLLFTSAFFQWPRGLRELFEARTAGPTEPRTPPVTGKMADPAEVTNLITASREHAEMRDYAVAWKQLERAAAIGRDDADVRNEQLALAMTWVRNINYVSGKTFSERIAPAKEYLTLAVTSAQGPLAADIRAHLGWAKYLRSRDRGEDTGFIADYEAAIAIDPENPFANVMWATWLAARQRPLEDIRARFNAALRSNREKTYVQSERINAIEQWKQDGQEAEFLRIADEQRREGFDLAISLRRKIAAPIYYFWARRKEDEFIATLTPAAHLATFHWIFRDAEPSEAKTAYYGYVLARLTEATGDYARALDLYRPLLGHDSIFEDRIQAGITRCQAKTR